MSADNSILRGAVIDPDGVAQPTKLATLRDTGLVGDAEIDETKISPMEIVARVFERPFTMDAAIAVSVMAPAEGATKPRNLPIGHFNVAVANKVTPEMLLAIVANLIASSQSAAEAVNRIRNEVVGWTFETSTGERG